MFSHIKAEEFVNLLEGIDLPVRRREHLRSCARCQATWHSMQTTHSEVSGLDNDIIEPDWAEFRSTVRNALLSRSVKRESVVRRWTGWHVRPAAAWALSIVLAIGITGAAMWNRTEPEAQSSIPEIQETPTVVATEPADSLLDQIDISGIEEEMQVWSQKGLFDEIAQLEEAQQEQLREMLEDARQETAERE